MAKTIVGHADRHGLCGVSVIGHAGDSTGLSNRIGIGAIVGEGNGGEGDGAACLVGGGCHFFAVSVDKLKGVLACDATGANEAVGYNELFASRNHEVNAARLVLVLEREGVV